MQQAALSEEQRDRVEAKRKLHDKMQFEQNRAKRKAERDEGNRLHDERATAQLVQVERRQLLRDCMAEERARGRNEGGSNTTTSYSTGVGVGSSVSVQPPAPRDTQNLDGPT